MSDDLDDKDKYPVLPLGQPGDISDDPRLADKQVRFGSDGKGILVGDAQRSQSRGASLSGPTPKYSVHHEDRAGLAGTKMGATKDLPKPAPKPMTYDELLAKANEMLAAKKAETESALAAGPALSARDDAGGILPDWLVKQRY